MFGVGTSIWNRALAGKGDGSGGNPPAGVAPLHSLDLTAAPSASNSFDDYGLATSRTVTDYNGRIVQIPADAVPMGGLRPVRNLWPTADGSDTPSTQVITVESGRVYQLRIGAESASGATAVCSGAFTGTLTGDGADIQAFDTGKTTTTTSLTVTITGSVRKIQLQDITHRADLSTAPDEYVSTGVGTGDELVTNGGFDTDISDWTEHNPADTISSWESGKVRVQNVGTQRGTVFQAIPTVVGATYEITADITYQTSGYARVEIATVPSVCGGTQINANSSGTYRYLHVVVAETSYINVGNRSDADIYHDYDNISVKRCDPGHTGIDGLAYFDTALANTVDGSGVVTELTGAALTGGYYDYQPGATNGRIRSEDFGTSWTLAGASITTDTTLAPDGSVAPKLTESVLDETHRIRGAGGTATSASGSVCHSIYAKAGERDTLFMCEDEETGDYCSFDLTNGTTTPGTGVAAPDDYGIDALSGGWYRCWVVYTVTASTDMDLRLGADGGDYAGDGSSGLYIWGSQIETGTVPTAYIPTSGSTVSRATPNPYPTISGLVGTEDARVTVQGVASDLTTPDPTDTTTRYIDIDNTDGEFDTLPAPCKVLDIKVYNDGERP